MIHVCDKILCFITNTPLITKKRILKFKALNITKFKKLLRQSGGVTPEKTGVQKTSITIKRQLFRRLHCRSGNVY
jgi:hypothetical protein